MRGPASRRSPGGPSQLSATASGPGGGDGTKAPERPGRSGSARTGSTQIGATKLSGDPSLRGWRARTTDGTRVRREIPKCRPGHEQMSRRSPAMAIRADRQQVSRRRDDVMTNLEVEPAVRLRAAQRGQA